jgi:hypothetical protein
MVMILQLLIPSLRLSWRQTRRRQTIQRMLIPSWRLSWRQTLRQRPLMQGCQGMLLVLAPFLFLLDLQQQPRQHPQVHRVLRQIIGPNASMR